MEVVWQHAEALDLQEHSGPSYFLCHLGEINKLSEPRFPNLQINSINNSFYLMGLYLNEDYM